MNNYRGVGIYRIRFNVTGTHVHCRLFYAKEPRTTFAKCGDFTVRRGVEFRDLIETFVHVEFVGDDERVGIADAITQGATP